MSQDFVCPKCRAALQRGPDDYTCQSCSQRYPIVCGIPDFRIFPDPYIGLEEDREKAARLAEKAQELSFEALVRHYFEITPEVPRELAKGYTQWIIEAGPVRAKSSLALLEGEIGPRPATARVLEVGAGAGPALPLLRERFGQVTAVDIALRWLVVTRKRLESLGFHDVELVCACAEQLPFASNQFDLTLALALLEHLQSPEKALEEMQRTLDKDGALLVTTPNRMSPAPDPHMGLWGLGLLPRAVARQVARLVRGVDFEKVRTLNTLELNRLMNNAKFRRSRLLLPEIDTRHLRGPLRYAGPIYNRLRGMPLLNLPLYVFGPQLSVVALKGPNRT